MDSRRQRKFASKRQSVAHEGVQVTVRRFPMDASF